MKSLLANPVTEEGLVTTINYRLLTDTAGRDGKFNSMAGWRQAIVAPFQAKVFFFKVVLSGGHVQSLSAASDCNNTIV